MTALNKLTYNHWKRAINYKNKKNMVGIIKIPNNASENKNIGTVQQKIVINFYTKFDVLVLIN